MQEKLFRTYELFMSRIFHLTFLDHYWVRVPESMHKWRLAVARLAEESFADVTTNKHTGNFSLWVLLIPTDILLLSCCWDTIPNTHKLREERLINSEFVKISVQGRMAGHTGIQRRKSSCRAEAAKQARDWWRHFLPFIPRSGYSRQVALTSCTLAPLILTLPHESIPAPHVLETSRHKP